MIHLETELKKLKESTVDMWELVINQLIKAHKSITEFDKEMAHEVAANEKRVDAYELKINMDCENMLAIFSPVANDLRFILSILKINYNLERIGDYANSIAKLVKEADRPFDEESLTEVKIDKMFTVATAMLTDAKNAFVLEDMKAVRVVFKNDDDLDKINNKANKHIGCLIERRPADVQIFLDLLSVIRKLERVGDQTKNIAEEIIFYAEAKILRHKKKKEKLEGIE